MELKLSLCFLLVLAVTATQAACVPVKVVRVIDGDTVDVSPINEPNKKIRVRMRYIDAPEKSQKYGKEATQFLKDMVAALGANKAIQLDAYKTDRYGRTIGEIYLGDDNLNKLMVDNGYAWCYRMRCPDNYKAGVDMAKLDKIGLFKDKNPVTPWDYRKSRMTSRKSKAPTVRQSADAIITAIPTVPTLSRSAERVEVKIKKVSDGDTITVNAVDNNDQMRVRMLFIDAPEKSQSIGADSTNFLKSTLVGSKKKLVIRVKGLDQYGRVLGVVYLGRRDVNKMMVASGYAWCYKTGCPSSYKAAMAQARQTARGVWEESNPQAPWNYRKYGVLKMPKNE